MFVYGVCTHVWLTYYTYYIWHVVCTCMYVYVKFICVHTPVLVLPVYCTGVHMFASTRVVEVPQHCWPKFVALELVSQFETNFKLELYSIIATTLFFHCRPPDCIQPAFNHLPGPTTILLWLQ